MKKIIGVGNLLLAGIVGSGFIFAHQHPYYWFIIDIIAITFCVTAGLLLIVKK